MSPFLKEWKSQYLGYSRNIRLFFLFNLVWNVGLGMFGLVYNLYVRSLGYDQTMLGRLVGVTAIASAMILIPAGILNDRFGPKRIVVAGLFGMIAAYGARCVLDSGQALTVTAFLGGLFTAVVSATLLPFMADNSSPKQRVHLFSFNMALVMFANVIGNVLGGLLGDTFQLILGYSDVAAFRLTLLIGVGIAASGLIPVLLYENDTEPGDGQASPGMEAPQPRWQWSWRKLEKRQQTSLKVIGLFVLLGLLTSTAGGMIIPYLNVYFEDRFAVSNTTIGLVVSLGQGATALAFLLGPAIAGKLGEARAVVVLQLSSIPFMLLTAYTSNFYLASVGYLFRQALMNAANPFYNSIKMKYVDRSMRGLASSSGDAVFNLGWFLAAPVSTGLVARYGAYYGYAYAFAITAAAYTLVSILFHYCFVAKARFPEAE